MTATFILSLDCEGKWGMADRLTPDIDRLISDESLTYVYDLIFRNLEKYNIAATFAVVGFFVAGPDCVSHFSPELSDSRAHNLWLKAPLRALRYNAISGWYKTDLIERLGSSNHEIASHGLTHLPFNAADVNDDARRLELTLMQKIGIQQGISFRTFVYPRNAVSRPGLLTDVGIEGYRTIRNFLGPRWLAPLENLASEFNIFEHSQLNRGEGRPVEIPSGIFLNWRHGLRRSVPVQLSVARWRHVLDHAERTNGIAHLWFHPHNLVTGPTGMHLLNSLLGLVAERQRSGRVIVRTQADYVATRLGV